MTVSAHSQNKDKLDIWLHYGILKW